MILLRLHFWRKVHRYLGWLLLLQLLCWFGSGLVMSLQPITEVRGEHLRQNLPDADWSAAISPAALVAKHPGYQLSLSQRGIEPVYLLSKAGQRWYYSANTGLALEALNETDIKAMVQLQYKGQASLVSIQSIQQPPFEARQLQGPVWQISFDDEQSTIFYLDNMTGKLLSVRTNQWRLYDFVWMLHIMDYQDRENFHHPLLIFFSATALFFTITGAFLLLPARRRKAEPIHSKASAIPTNSNNPL